MAGGAGHLREPERREVVETGAVTGPRRVRSGARSGIDGARRLSDGVSGTAYSHVQFVAHDGKGHIGHAAGITRERRDIVPRHGGPRIADQSMAIRPDQSDELVVSL